MKKFEELTEQKKALNRIVPTSKARPPKRRRGNIFLQRPVPAFDYDTDNPRKTLSLRRVRDDASEHSACAGVRVGGVIGQTS